MLTLNMRSPPAPNPQSHNLSNALISER